MRRLTAFILAAATAFCFAACTGSGIDISRPEQIATFDEPSYLKAENGAVEESFNVNGRRFNLTLYEFTSKLNAEKTLRGDTDLLQMENWKKNGQVTKDNKGVRIQYYFYDDEKVNLTATVEVDCEKLVNIGCGTTMSRFMGMEGDKKNSDIILNKAALMAEVACGFPDGSESVLQDIFFKTATENEDSLWYKGYVFNLSTKEDEDDSKNNIMLFRVFPVTDSLKDEWKLKEYGK